MSDCTLTGAQWTEIIRVAIAAAAMVAVVALAAWAWINQPRTIAEATRKEDGE